MTDIVTQSLGHTPEYKQSLVERRQQYEDWLTSGRKAPRPIVPGHTGIAHSRVDDVDTGHKATPPEVFTLNELPPGAIVRTDEGNEKVEMTDDLRFDLAKALLPKIEGANVDQAERIARAANSILGPAVARLDDAKADDAKADDTGTNLKNKVLGDEDKDKKDDNAPTLQSIMDAIGAIGARLDKIEGKGKDGEHTVNEPKSRKAADDDGLRDDSFKVRTKIEGADNEVHSWKNQDAFAAFQRRADSVMKVAVSCQCDKKE